MIRIHLDDATRDELRAAAAEVSTTPGPRSSSRCSPWPTPGGRPRIAAPPRLLRAQTVRDRLRDFLARGTDALSPRRTGPAPDTGRRDRVAEVTARSLARGRTWDRPPFRRGPRRCAKDAPWAPARAQGDHLKRIQAGYRRTRLGNSKHKQDPAKAAQAGRVLVFEGQGGGRLDRAPLPGRVRLLADASDGLQLDPAGAEEVYHPCEGPAVAESTPTAPTEALRAVAPARRVHGPNGPGTRHDLIRVPEGPST